MATPDVEADAATGANTTNTDQCPGCGQAIDAGGGMTQGQVRRYSCLGCGLQLVKRAGQGWQSIRG